MPITGRYRGENGVNDDVPAALKRERLWVLIVGVVVVTLRSGVFVFFDAIFDSDQAIVGLMAKHIGEGRALPVFTYGQDYQLAIEAWLAAPLFWLFGPSVLALKLPLLFINIAIVWLLLGLLERELGLRPMLALVVASPFIVVPPGTAIYFLEASGGQVEPLFAALLLWLTRHRPLTFGTILAVAFLTRVFSAYIVSAVLLIELLNQTLLTRAGIERWTKIAAAFTATWQAIGLIRSRVGSAWGPATSDLYSGLPMATSDSASLNVGLLFDRFCFDASSLPRAVIAFFGPFLSTMVGGHRHALADLAIPSPGNQGLDGLWWLLGGGLLVATCRSGMLTMTGVRRPWHPGLQFSTFLILIGLQSSVVYVLSQCGQVSAMTMRYTLMTVLGLVGLVGYHAVIETRSVIRWLVLGIVAVWALIGLIGHTTLLAEFVRQPPQNNRQQLADYLVDHDIRYGYADFWDSYSTIFFADERVILSSPVWFIQEYEWIVQNHTNEAVFISRVPCPGGTQATEVHYVCPP